MQHTSTSGMASLDNLKTLEFGYSAAMERVALRLVSLTVGLSTPLPSGRAPALWRFSW